MILTSKVLDKDSVNGMNFYSLIFSQYFPTDQ
jgi:hypothetical protein